MGETHTFVHIPKTGGTSIESLLRKEQSIEKQITNNKGASPWHLPVDVFEEKYGRNYTQAPFERTFCVVCEPRERLRSCVNWASAYHGSWEEPMANVAVQVSNGRRNV